MHDPLTFEARLGDAYERFLAGAQTDVDPVATATVAATRRGGWISMPWTAPRSMIALRPLIVLLVLALLAAATSIYIIASARPDRAFGPAGNGLLAYTTGNDLFVSDQRAGPRLLAAGVGFGAQWSRDGSRVATIRPIVIRTHEIGELSGGSGDPNYCSEAVLTCVDEIVLTGLDGRSVVAATLAHMSWLLDWSPDGRHLLVETADLDAEICCSQKVVLVSADGGAAVSIGTMLGGLHARFTPSTDAPILYLGTRDDQVVLRSVARDGLPLADLATTSRREGSSTSFDVRPDGSQIAFATDTSLALLRPDGTQDRVLPVPGVSSVRYSPDGTWLLIDAYTAEVPDKGSILIRADGSTSGEPVSADATLGACQWAPNGTQLLCLDAASNGWLVDLETRALTPTTLSGDETQFGIAWQRIPAR